MQHIQINTSQNVKINFLQASIGLRILSFFIDTLIKVSYLMCIYWVANKLGLFYYFDDKWSSTAIGIIISSPAIFYTLFFESLMEGQTPAKRWIQLKVIKIDGYQAFFSDYLTRWFFGIIDFYFSSGVVSVLFIIAGKEGQRAGGLASGTTVINIKKNITLDNTIFMEVKANYVVTFKKVLLFSDNDMQVIRTHFDVAKENNDYELIGKLSKKITSVIQSDQGELNNIDFINTIIKDYNFMSSAKNK